MSITLLTDLKKLREMQSKEPARADEHGNAVCCDVEYINALYSHAPAMLEVLRCSQGGDAVELDRIGRILERAFHDPTALWGYTREDRLDMLDCIKLHQKAASLMEGQ